MSEDVTRRIDQHNRGEVFSTKGYRPWTLIYVETIGTISECRKKEKYYKSGCGKEYLKSLAR